MNTASITGAAKAKLPNFYSLELGPTCLRPRYWTTWMMLGLYRLSALLPLRICRWLGAAYGWSFLVLNRKRRRIAYTNLAMCFPELSVPERKRLLRQHFLVTGQSYVDLGWLAWATKERLERRVQLLGLEHLSAEIGRGKNVILLAPHCVGINFGTIVAKEHAQFSMFKPPRNILLNWLLNKGRMRFGCRLLMRNQGMRPVVRALQQGMIFYYIPDEDFGPGRSVFAPFFGVQMATLATLGRLADLTDAAVLPFFTRLLPAGRGYQVTLGAALEDFPTGDRDKDATRMNQVLEQGIRKMPAQYMWTLKLFKTRPDNGPSPYS
ncbi:MAG: lipid A biosynthesis acyltransferase [Proteobacteria bacterium]|nr:lipid A biosynthesis acyltransferase [Pseudomonadota bacterium]